jgi:hypothetical protein
MTSSFTNSKRLHEISTLEVYVPVVTNHTHTHIIIMLSTHCRSIAAAIGHITFEDWISDDKKL